MYGLTWGNVDLDEGTVTIARQLDEPGVEPVFGPTKTDRARTLPLNAQTVLRLREHRRHQSELKMANRTVYADFGLVFAREHAHLQRSDAKLGQPIDCLDVRAFQNVIKAAGVRRIKFHGLRRTCATLMLAHNVPVHVVAQRLGHADATITLGVYAHVMPSGFRKPS
jgi:integrase